MDRHRVEHLGQGCSRRTPRRPPDRDRSSGGIPRTDARSDSETRRSARPNKAIRVIHSPSRARKVRPDPMNETATTIDAAGPGAPPPAPRRGGARPAAVRRGRRGVHGGASRCSSSSSSRLAAARGRDAAAVRRPATDRRPLRHRPRQARRRAAPLPPRLGRGARREAASRPCASSPRCSRWRASRRSRSSATGSPAAGLALAAAALAAGELGPALPRHLRAHVQPLPLPLDALVPRAAPRARPRRPRAWIALGDRHAARDRVAPVRRARARLAGALRPGDAAAGSARRVVAFGAVLLLAIPLWRSSVVLANRLDVGVGRRRRQAAHAAGGVRVPLARRRRRLHRLHAASSSSCSCSRLIGLVWHARGTAAGSALLTGCVVLTPTLFFLVGRFGGNSAPESRHLIFVLPFLALAAASGIVAASRSAGRFGALLAALVVLAIVPREVAWAWHKTPGSVRPREPGPGRRPPRGRRVARRDLTARRRALRLRAGLPRRLGAQPLVRSRGRSCRAPTRSSRSRRSTRRSKPLGRGVWASTPATTTTP